VLDKPEIQQTKWYKNSSKTALEQVRGNKTLPLERLRDSLSVRPRRQTEIIDVTFVDSRAQEAQLIVDAVLNQYMAYIALMSSEDEKVLYSQLLEEYESLSKRIDGHEKTIADFHKALETQNPQELISSRRTRLDEMETRYKNLQNMITLLEWEAQAARY